MGVLFETVQKARNARPTGLLPARPGSETRTQNGRLALDIALWPTGSLEIERAKQGGKSGPDRVFASGNGVQRVKPACLFRVGERAPQPRRL